MPLGGSIQQRSLGLKDQWMYRLITGKFTGTQHLFSACVVWYWCGATDAEWVQVGKRF